MRGVTLSALEAGITRLRTKGGASPKALYDLANGYVTAERDVVIRQGSVIDANITAGTKGLFAWHSKFYVFANTPVAMIDSRFVCEVLVHPTNRALTVSFIHFCEPFVGALYVAAQFSDGSVSHFWLQHPPKWKAATAYKSGDTVEPTVPNGLIYRASGIGTSAVKWAAGVPRTVGDKVEPTVYNGYYYLCITTLGTHPASGTLEPVWPTTEGAQVYEDTNVSTVTATAGGVVTPPTGATTPPPTTVGSYGSGVGADSGAVPPPKITPPQIPL